MAKKSEINLGISDADRKKIADGLSHLLADSYTLYLLTHNFHWNVTYNHVKPLALAMGPNSGKK
jgi:starvation-inducible DNA-binding protein